MYFLRCIKVQKDTEVASKLDYYLAQIAAECRRAIAKYPRAVKLESFLLKFKFGKKGKVEEVIKDPEARMKKSKASWLGALGLGKDGK